LGIAIHNLPEGLSVFAGFSTGNTALRLLVATAIALHKSCSYFKRHEKSDWDKGTGTGSVAQYEVGHRA